MTASQVFPDVLNYGAPGVAVALSAKYISETFRNMRHRRRGSTDAVADAATTNALLLNALKEERAESRRKDDRNDALEAEIEALRNQVFELRTEYEHQLAELRAQLSAAIQQLDNLQHRLQAGPPPIGG